MWTTLFLVLFCRIGMAWSYQLHPLDLGHLLNVFELREFNEFRIRMIRNEDFIDNNDSVIDKPEVFKRNYGISLYSRKPIRPDQKPVVVRSIEACPTLEKLFEAYFRPIDVEEISESWKLFSSYWNPDDISKRFGFPKEYATRDYGYVLIKVSLVQHEAMMSYPSGVLTFKDDVQKELDEIKTNDGGKIFSFYRKYGTHFIHSFSTGGLLYQVFVYNKILFADVEEAIGTQFISGGNEELQQSQRKFFSPRYAIQIGKIQSADADDGVEEWARSVSRQRYHPCHWSNLLDLYDNSSALVEFQDYAHDKVLVKLTLTPIFHYIELPEPRSWFFSALDIFFYNIYRDKDYYYHPIVNGQPYPQLQVEDFSDFVPIKYAEKKV